MDNVTAFLVLELGLAALAVYLLPTIVELSRGHHRPWVLGLNIALGWTVVGWAVALGAALAQQKARPGPPRTPSAGAPPGAPGPPPSMPLKHA